MNWFLGEEVGNTSRGVESTNVETVVDRCPELINTRQIPLLVYTQPRPSSLLSRVTGTTPQPHPSSLLSRVTLTGTTPQPHPSSLLSRVTGTTQPYPSSLLSRVTGTTLP